MQGRSNGETCELSKLYTHVTNYTFTLTRTASLGQPNMFDVDVQAMFRADEKGRSIIQNNSRSIKTRIIIISRSFSKIDVTFSSHWTECDILLVGDSIQHRLIRFAQQANLNLSLLAERSMFASYLSGHCVYHRVSLTIRNQSFQPRTNWHTLDL